MREEVYSRHYFIIDYLRANITGKRLEQIHNAVAEEFTTCQRTVRRDLQALRRHGFPLVEDKTASGTFYKYVGKERSSAPVSFDPVEAMSLVLARDALNASGDTFFSSRIDGLLGRLSKLQSAEFRRSLQKLEKSVYCHSVRPALYPNCEKLITAINKRRKLLIDYRNSKGETTRNRLLAPLQFWISNTDTYLVAHCYLRNENRFFSLKRIQKVQVTSEPFGDDLQFSPEKHAKTVVGIMQADPQDIELIFDDILVEYFNTHEIHASQQVCKMNGYNVLTMHVGINESLVHELLGFGPRITVTRPDVLRSIILQRLSESISAYRGPIPSPQESLPLVFS